MDCPRCEIPMGKGAPHSESEAFQWQCPRCDKRIGEPLSSRDIEPHRYLPMNTAWMRKS